MFLQLDLPVLAAGMFASIACALVGTFLVLRRMSLMGDAISHAVVPGIVGAFLVASWMQRQGVAINLSVAFLLGAAIVGIMTALLTELIHRVGRVESTAAMGVVFTVLFAVGVIMLAQLESAGATTIHLDAECVLYGTIENAIWPDPPASWSEMFDVERWRGFPRQVTTLAIVALLDLLFVFILFKELRITSFDPELAAAQGMRPGVMHYLLMTFVAFTTIAAFEAAGSILVVAMLIVPALVAHLFADRLGVMLVVATVVAIAASIAGYAAAATLSFNAAGSIGLMLGVLLALAGLFAPGRGWISQALRRVGVRVSIAREDMLGYLYRMTERARGEIPATRAPGSMQANAPIPAETLREAVGGGFGAKMALRQLLRRGEARMLPTGAVVPTETGLAAAADLVRSHRLWEAYLVERIGLRPDHVHDTAMQLEHITDRAMQDQLAERVEASQIDPHGKAIPDIRR
jgi:manganese/zinc/iron transport system permease protein